MCQNRGLFHGSIKEPHTINASDEELTAILSQYNGQGKSIEGEDIRDLTMFLFSEADDLIKFDDAMQEAKIMVNVGLHTEQCLVD